MKIRYRLIAITFTVPLVIVSGYYFLSPKAVVSNHSEINYDEFVISLPSSRISFSPVSADSSTTILYSQQKLSGQASYSLRNGSTELFKDTFSYPEGSEIGRVLRFTIESDGQVTFDD